MKTVTKDPLAHLNSLFHQYLKQYPGEKSMTLNCQTLLKEDQLLSFKRENLKAHFTGSAFICSQDYSMTLLTHHAKLGIWVQPGGHADGDPDLLRVSLKEAEEETGITEFNQPRPGIYDLDIHRIPEHKGIPAHFHYDIRFLFTADPSLPLIITEESRDLKWFPLDQVTGVTNEESVLRMIRKIKT